MDVKNVFNAIDRLNQAIYPKFLGPLFLKGLWVSSMFLVWDRTWYLYWIRGPRRAERAATMLDV